MNNRLTQILLIEDNQGDAELLQDLLEQVRANEFAIAHVTRLRDVLNYLQPGQFDVILLDLSLPDSHGLETLMQVQTQAPTVPIVVLTGTNDEDLAIKAVRNGAQDYLVKGQVDGHLLKRAIHYAIERKQTLEALRQSEERFQTLAANLDRQVQERTRQLQQALDFEAMLKRITDKVRDSLDESQILQTVVQELAQGLSVDYCDASLYNLSLTEATVCYEYAKDYPSFLGRVVTMAENADLYAQLLRKESFQFCPRVLHWRGYRAAILAIPISDDRCAIGDLCLFKQPQETFNEMEIRLVQQVANQCAIALRQARLYQASLAQVRELARLNRLKDDFLSTVSHELRTPVANIKMAAQMLDLMHVQQPASSTIPTAGSSIQPIRKSTSREPPQDATPNPADRYIKILLDECEREIKLIDNILELQQLDAGVEPLDFRPIQLQHWIPHVVEPFERLAQQNQQVMRVAMEPNLPALVSDVEMLRRILSELLNNACKYTPPEEEIAIAVECDRSVVRIQVTNSGIEIPSSELSHVFEKFYRVPSTDPWKHSGTGLGLALVQKLTHHLGGTMQVSSGSGQTCFTLELPVTLSESAIAETPLMKIEATS